MPSTVIRMLSVPLLLAIVLPTRLAGQTDPRLVAAVRQAQEGQSDSARAAVQRLFTTTPTTDNLYPQLLYTAGVVADDADEMRRRFQQVAVEFPMSAWTDDALLRLGQLDYASHQLEAATRDLERIALDFPGTDIFPQAAYWAGRAYFDLNKPAEACRWLADGMARSRDDVEIQTQLGYLYQRCNVATAPADSAPQPQPAKADSATRSAASSRPATPSPATQPKQPAATTQPRATSNPTSGHYRVQITAVGTTAAAEAAARRAQALGYRTVTVHESGLYKVRAGEFATRADAQRAVPSLKTKLGGSPFVVASE